MPKFAVDISQLETKLTKRAYRLADVKDQLETVAFDIVRWKSDDKGAELWQVQNSADGDYIVALYEDEEDLTKKASQPWGVLVAQNGQDLQVSYKGDPLVRLSASKLGIPPTELHKAEQYLPARLASSQKLVNALLRELPESSRVAVSKRYPELTSK